MEGFRNWWLVKTPMRALLAIECTVRRVLMGRCGVGGRRVVAVGVEVGEVSSRGGANRPRAAATAIAAGRLGQRNHRWPELPDPCSSVLCKRVHYVSPIRSCPLLTFISRSLRCLTEHYIQGFIMNMRQLMYFLYLIRILIHSCHLSSAGSPKSRWSAGAPAGHRC